jgi:acyl-CoA hydrolase
MQCQNAEAVLEHVRPGTDIVLPLATGEPVALLNVLEAHADRLDGVRVHQMHALRDRRYLYGDYGRKLRHVSYFLSDVTRDRFRDGTIDLVPNHFSDVPALIRSRSTDPLVMAVVSPPDRHGFVSLGTNADYVASFIGRARFFVEVNPRMPRTFGRNQLHLSQLVGWCEAEHELHQLVPATPGPVDEHIADHIAERIPNGATIQTGIGTIPNAVLAKLRGHRNIGIHTELISDGLVELMELGVANGVSKRINRTKAVGTFALGSQRVYDFLADNPAVELWPVNYVNNPAIIAQEPGFIAINATVEVDLLGQCASETIKGRYWSSSGGQADFGIGAMESEGGQGFIVLPSTTKHGESRIVPVLQPGTVVTTSKNTVDHVVTEWGVATMRGRTIRERANALIKVAHPDHRDALRQAARELHYI